MNENNRGEQDEQLHARDGGVMADITMCRKASCAVRHECYRYLAVPEIEPRQQAYSDYTLCSTDHADMYPISGMVNPVIRAWRDVDAECPQTKKAGISGN